MTPEEDLEKDKNKLVEQFGVFMEKQGRMAPIAARIMATLIIIGKEGITFEKLVQDLQASKSTISTHLDHLQNEKRIKYYTKTGDRKRYFIVNENLMMNIIDEMLSKWKTEKKIHQKVMEYKRKENELESTQPSTCDLSFQKDYLIFLEEATTAIEKLKTKIKEKKHLTNQQ